MVEVLFAKKPRPMKGEKEIFEEKPAERVEKR